MKLVIDNNLTFEDHVRIAEIEKEYFDIKYHTSPELTWEYYNHNKDTFICVRDLENGIIAAHLCVIPLTDEISEKIIDGTMIDSCIDCNDIIKYNIPGKYKLHISVIAIANEYKKHNLTLFIFRGLKDKIIDLETRGIVFTGFTADCVNNDGAMLCERLLNMKCIKDTERNSKIYWTDELFHKNCSVKEVVSV